MISTQASTFFKTVCGNFNDPSQDPQSPPAKATSTNPNMSVLKWMPRVSWPESPATEFTKINNALMAAVCF